MKRRRGVLLHFAIETIGREGVITAVPGVCVIHLDLENMTFLRPQPHHPGQAKKKYTAQLKHENEDMHTDGKSHA